MSDETFERAVELFGDEALVDVIGVLGNSSLLALAERLRGRSHAALLRSEEDLADVGPRESMSAFSGRPGRGGECGEVRLDRVERLLEGRALRLAEPGEHVLLELDHGSE